MRKISCYLLLGLLGALFDGCNQDAIVSPSQPSFTVDNQSPFVGNTVTFTVNQVTNAQAITLFPYGIEVANVAQAGVTIDPSSFVNGKAQVGFSYGKIGSFQAVVVSNAHSGNGNTVKNVTSAPIAMTVGSHQAALLSFGLLLNPSVVADTVTVPGVFPKTGTALTLVLPYGNGKTQTNLKTGVKGVFTSSPFSTVTTSPATQDFSGPVTITVTAADGTSTQSYTLNCSVTPVEKTKSFTAQAKDVSKAAKSKILTAAVDSVAGTIVVYDTLNSVPASDFDSLRFEYAFKGSFAVLKYGSVVLKQDSLFNVSSNASPKTFIVHGQDSTTQSYKLYAVAGPLLELQFSDLNPTVTPQTTNFGISADVLKGTDLTGVDTYTSTLTAAPGTTITGVTANGVPYFGTGDSVNYTTPAVFVITVNDGNLGISYNVTYTVTLNVVK